MFEDNLSLSGGVDPPSRLLVWKRHDTMSEWQIFSIWARRLGFETFREKFVFTTHFKPYGKSSIDWVMTILLPRLQIYFVWQGHMQRTIIGWFTHPQLGLNSRLNSLSLNFPNRKFGRVEVRVGSLWSEAFEVGLLCPTSNRNFNYLNSIPRLSSFG